MEVRELKPDGCHRDKTGKLSSVSAGVSQDTRQAHMELLKNHCPVYTLELE